MRRLLAASLSAVCVLGAGVALPAVASGASGTVDAVVLVDDGMAGTSVAAGSTSVYDTSASDTVTAVPPAAGATGLTFTVKHPDSNAVNVLLAPATGTKFVSGTTYSFGSNASATLAGLQSPALCSGLTGSLVVDDVAYTSTTISSLTAHFTGTCTNQHRGSGELRWNSNQGYAAAAATYTSLTVGTGASTAFDVTVSSLGTLPLHTTTFTAPTGVLGSELTFDASACATRTLAPAATCVIHGTATGGVSPSAAFGSARLAADTTAGDISLPLFVTVINQPAAPGNLRVDPAVDGSRVLWSAVSGATSYELQRSTNGGPFADVATGAGLLAFADTDTAAGTPVSYRVRALSGSATGTWATLSLTSPDRTSAGSGTTNALVVTAVDGADANQNALHTSGLVPTTDPWSVTLTPPTGQPVTFSTVAELGTGTFSTTDSTLRSVSIGSCGGQGSVVVHSFAIHADGTLALLDADADVTGCGHLQIALRWNASSSYTAVTSSPNTVAVGTVAVGQSSTAHTVKVFNQGAASVTLGTASLVGSLDTGGTDPVTDWAVTNDNCAGATVAPGGSCAVTLTYAPTVRGNANGSLSYAINGGPGVAGFVLTAAGITAPAAPTLSLRVQPDQIGVTVTPNTDTGGSPITALRLYVGPNASSLVFTSNVTNGQTYWITGLHAGDQRTISVSAVNLAGEGAQTTSVAVVPSQALVYAATGTQTAPPITGAIELRAGTQDGQPTEAPVASGLWCDTSTPAVSPDRTLVAYAYDDCLSTSIALAPTGPTGTARQVISVSDSTGTLQDPAFSPDGKTLAYTECGSGGCAVSAIALTAGGLSTIPGGDGLSRPVWTLDGTAIIATSTSGTTTKLVRVTVATGATVTIAGTAGAMQAALSPDGTTLAFTHLDTSSSTGFTSSLWTVPVGGGTPTKIAAPVAEITYPAWAADGTGIFFDHYTSDSSVINETVNGVTSLVPTRALWAAWEPAVLSEDTVAPTVTSLVGAWTTAAPSLAFTVADRTTPRSSLTVTCALDSGAATACTSPYVPGTLAPGPHTLTIRATDPSGNVGMATSAFSVDVVAPSVPTYSATPVFSGSVVAKAASITVTLAGTDAGSGVGSYQLRTRTGTLGGTLGAFTAGATVAATSTHAASVGHQWCASARTVDAVGNASAWSAQQCVLVPFDDASLTNAHWTRGTATGTFAGTVSSTATKGATLSRSGFAGTTVLLVAKVCSTCGKLTVAAGGTTKTVSLVSSATSHWAVVSVSLGARKTGTLVLTMTATTGTAYVDAVAWS